MQLTQALGKAKSATASIGKFTKALVCVGMLVRWCVALIIIFFSGKGACTKES